MDPPPTPHGIFPTLLYEGHYLMEVPEACGTLPRFSKGGWFLKSGGTHSIFLLQSLYEGDNRCPGSTFFNNPPTSADCTIFGIWPFSNNSIMFAMLSRGDMQWTFQEIQNDSIFVPSHTNPVFFTKSHSTVWAKTVIWEFLIQKNLRRL